MKFLWEGVRFSQFSEIFWVNFHGFVTPDPTAFKMSNHETSVASHHERKELTTLHCAHIYAVIVSQCRDEETKTGVFSIYSITISWIWQETNKPDLHLHNNVLLYTQPPNSPDTNINNLVFLCTPVTLQQVCSFQFTKYYQICDRSLQWLWLQQD